MRALAAVAVLCLLLTACREVRVKSYAQGTTTVLGPDAIVIIRNPAQLQALGIKAPVRFNHEFAVVLLMGPHKDSGWKQIVESIRANEDRVRIVAFDRGPFQPGDPVPEYRTYTLWIVPNLVYRSGSHVDVVTPSGDPVASTVLR
ncbi:MAG TPA: hypothetical protein VN905_06840 [Candidatus Binatia bacterium]|nr:hypothetical protein [Candidatus Binatia bacterium]